VRLRTELGGEAAPAIHTGRIEVKEEFRIQLRGMPQPEKGWIRTIAKPTQEGLLESYAEKPLRGFMEIDAHGLCEEEVVIHTNFGYELRNTANPVRVQIPEGVRRGEALYYLQEIAKMLREDWHRLDVVGGEGHGGRPKPRRNEA
jgi:hypothetical protein